MRTKNSLLNFATSIIPYVVFVILGFVKVNVWQSKMDQDIYALNQLFFQLFAYLSIAEEGIGPLVQKKYYSLLIDKDKDSVCKYYSLSRSLLRKTCYIVFIAGILLSFFLKYLSKDNSLSLLYMQEIFILFLVKSLVEYFMFSPRFLLTADQKLYKINIQSYGYKLAECLMEIGLIYIGVSYVLVLLLSIFLRIVMNLHLNRLVFKEYPWLKPLKPDKDMSLKGMNHIMIFRIVTVIQENLGTLLISAFINPLSVIIYTNYKYITKYIKDFIGQIGISLGASVGNLLNDKSEDNQKVFNTFQMISTLFYFIAAFLTLTLSFCINPFISVWVGENKLLDNVSLLCLLFVFFHNIARRSVFILRDVFVLYKDIQINLIIEAIVTLLLSFGAIKLNLGIRGILIASAISPLLISFAYIPIKIYKKIFNVFPTLDFIKYFASLIMILVLHFIGTLIPFEVSSSNFIMWLITSALVAIILGIMLFAVYWCLFKSFRCLVNTGLWTVKNIFKKTKA